MGVAFLTNLRDFQFHLAHAQAGADGQRVQGNAFGSDVLGKNARRKPLHPQRAHLVHACLIQEAHLAVPVAGVRVAFNPKLFE